MSTAPKLLVSDWESDLEDPTQRVGFYCVPLGKDDGEDIELGSGEWEIIVYDVTPDDGEVGYNDGIAAAHVWVGELAPVHSATTLQVLPRDGWYHFLSVPDRKTVKISMAAAWTDVTVSVRRKDFRFMIAA